MQIAHSIKQLRQHVRSWRHACETVGFVPTMGNSHKGHFSLIQRAIKCTNRVVVCIFVNLTQFGARADSSYPQWRLEDQKKLRNFQGDVLFLPKIKQQQIHWLQQSGFQPENFSISHSADLQSAKKSDAEPVILTAENIAKTRLIDNLDFIKA